MKPKESQLLTLDKINNACIFGTNGNVDVGLKEYILKMNISQKLYPRVKDHFKCHQV
jgi:hypothetical protein